MTRSTAKLLGLCVLGSMLAANCANALDWPTRSVQVIVPIAAGGNTDMMARIGAEGLAAKFDQPFVVENRSSAGGAVGVSQVARSKPDGYTLLFAASTMAYLTPLLQKVDFDPDKDLTPITNIGTGAQVLGIRKSLPVTQSRGTGRLRQGQSGQAELRRCHADAQSSRAGDDVRPRRHRCCVHPGERWPPVRVRSDL